MGIRWPRVALAVLGGVLAIYLCAGASVTPALTIEVMPRVVLAGASLRVICRVRKDPANRWLDLGVPDVRISGRQLDGDEAPSFHELRVERVPCGATQGFCRLRGASERWAWQTIEVAGCQ